MSKKPIIFLVDDELKITGEFKLWHGGELLPKEVKALEKIIKDDKKSEKRKKEALEIELKKYKKQKNREETKWDVRTINDGTKLSQKLQEMIDNGETPNAILIDQQYNGKNLTPQKEAEWKDSGKIFIEAKRILLDLEITAEKEGIYENRGVAYLKIARKLCPETPIAIYTTYGLALADIKTLIEVASEKGEWIKKGGSPEYEDLRFEMLINKKEGKEKNTVPEEYQNKIFFISPFGDENSIDREHSDRIYKEVLNEIEIEENFTKKFIRADEISTISGMIKKMYDYIYFSEIIIADLIGFNSNVMHEIGMAFAWGKCPILIGPKELKNEKLPFDIPSDYKIIYYDQKESNFTAKLKNELKKLLDDIASKPDQLINETARTLLENYK